MNSVEATIQTRKQINLLKLWLELWRAKLFILLFASLVTAGVVSYSLTMPNVYKSNVVLSPQEQSDKSALGALGQIGGLASLAGVNISTGGSSTEINLEILKSKDFLYPFFEKYQVGKEIFAVKEYDRENKRSIYDDLKIDRVSGAWKMNPENGEPFEPTLYDIYEKFNKIFFVKHDKATNLVNVEVKNINPYVAKQWVDGLVLEINSLLRKRELKEKRESIAYITQQLEKTDVAQMRSVFYTIIEEQTKQMLLAEVREDFAFKIIESPIVAERKDSPSRAVIAILALIFSVFFACGLVLVRFFISQIKQLPR